MEYICIFLLAGALLATLAAAVVQPNVQEGLIIADCLKNYGGLTEDKAQRLVRFKDWSDHYEEIPCFTKCYIQNMFEMFDESEGFKEEQVIKQFGQPLYKACKHRMVPAADTCQQAYNGFHCIVSLEDDPFVLIESMKNVSTEAKTAMKDCLHRYDRYEWEHMKDYAANPVREPIPCFTKCFVEHLQVFNQKTRQWNIPLLRAKLGVPAVGADIKHCLERRRNRNVCGWMYQDFTCFGLPVKSVFTNSYNAKERKQKASNHQITRKTGTPTQHKRTPSTSLNKMKFRKASRVFLLITLSICIQMVNSATTTRAAATAGKSTHTDAEILRKCLRQVGSIDLASELQKVQRYSKWTKEEIPCFTRCLATEKRWFDADASKWHKQQIADDLGADMFNYCRYELDRYNEDGCEFAYTGLRCLKQAEFYLPQTLKNILSCASELNVTMNELKKYAGFPEKEVVPCLFQCLAKKLNFYTSDYEWNFDNWIRAFGPMRQDRLASIVCKVSAEHIATRDKCEWMYEEYNCLERLNYNTDGSYPLTETTTLSAALASKNSKTMEVVNTS
ncbi:uncharacterized protein LOC101459207 [Ceratitis capitata]|nr:uncharacterized protein LOC101459207 [Ceratitis capitata]